eukprot:CAMPEP_0169275476 /NCGR_PEP_ID=MMETSP1016-20121227/52400_1 /TAXON_ID=342587 /ORGANISM="Karlodinium micrum, Strain CCMP2283" /LENGTH=95 /DNA_ID=CAMNT_0009362349 /DNA_START=18 /DNA_END=305 /DNA_ORIENTATION=+
MGNSIGHRNCHEGHGRIPMDKFRMGLQGGDEANIHRAACSNYMVMCEKVQGAGGQGPRKSLDHRARQKKSVPFCQAATLHIDGLLQCHYTNCFDA